MTCTNKKLRINSIDHKILDNGSPILLNGERFKLPSLTVLAIQPSHASINQMCPIRGIIN